MTPVIVSARLTLRPVVLADAPAIVAGVGNWDVAKWLAVVPHPYDLADAHLFITEIIPESGDFWAIDDGSFAGIVSIDDHLGYWLAEDRWGRGYMTEATLAAISWYFENRADDAISSGYFTGNARSGAVLNKLGFEKSGDGRKYCLARGDDLDHQDVRLTRTRWYGLSNRR